MDCIVELHLLSGSKNRSDVGAIPGLSFLSTLGIAAGDSTSNLGKRQAANPTSQA
jgi:hypothetical protein